MSKLKKRKPVPFRQIGDLGPQRVGLELGPNEGTLGRFSVIERYKFRTTTQ